MDSDLCGAGLLHACGFHRDAKINVSALRMFKDPRRCLTTGSSIPQAAGYKGSGVTSEETASRCRVSSQHFTRQIELQSECSYCISISVRIIYVTSVTPSPLVQRTVSKIEIRSLQQALRLQQVPTSTVQLKFAYKSGHIKSRPRIVHSALVNQNGATHLIVRGPTGWKLHINTQQAHRQV